MARILSTKKLLPNQKQFLLNAGLSVIEADFIQINYKSPELQEIKNNLIFTSQNAVRSVLQMKDHERLRGKNCFCVGTKTRALLEEKGFQVMASPDYASDLGAMISKDYQDQSFTFLSGNLRQDLLPDILRNACIDFNETEVYETVLTPVPVKSTIDGILFFSPSAVQSYKKDNTIANAVCFCIGNTTAAALEHKTQNIIIANQPSVENTIIQCINYYNTVKAQP